MGNNEERIGFHTRISPELKKRIQKHAIDFDLSTENYVAYSLKHFADHIDRKEISFSENIFEEDEESEE